MSEEHSPQQQHTHNVLRKSQFGSLRSPNHNNSSTTNANNNNNLSPSTPNRSRSNSAVKDYNKESSNPHSRHVSTNLTQISDGSDIASPIIPTNKNAVDILIHRINVWRIYLKELSSFFKQSINVDEGRAKELNKLSQTISNPFDSEGSFLKQGNGGILDLSSFLSTRARDISQQALTSAKVVETQIVPLIDQTRADLQLKIKEIKSHSGDFKNRVLKESDLTHKYAEGYRSSLSSFEQNPQINARDDPFLSKVALDYQLSRHLSEENGLHKAHLTVQAIAQEAEKEVLNALTQAFVLYRTLASGQFEFLEEITSNPNLGRAFTLYEWDSFINRSPDLINPSTRMRQIGDIVFDGYHSPAGKPLQKGILERRTKFLKSYNPAYYVLTFAGYLHEFKLEQKDEPGTPLTSIYIPHCSLGERANEGDVSHKFVLTSRSGGRSSSYVFRAETHEDMIKWYSALAKIIDLPDVSAKERSELLSTNTSTTYTQDDDFEEDDETADQVPYTSSLYSKHEDPSRLAGIYTPDLTQENQSFFSNQGKVKPTAAYGVDPELSSPVPPTATKQGDDYYPQYIGGNEVYSGNYHESEHVSTRPRLHERSASAYSYEERHPYKPDYDDNLEIEGADIPPEQEVAFLKNTLKPEKADPIQDGIEPEQKPGETTKDALARHTSISKDKPFVRKTPARKPTAQYGMDNYPTQAEHTSSATHTTSPSTGWGTAVAGKFSEILGEEDLPENAKNTTSSNVVNDGGQLHPSTTSKSIHVPGEYPQTPGIEKQEKI